MKPMKTMRIADVYTNNKGKSLYISTSASGHRIVGDNILIADADSTTLSRYPTIEVPAGVLPEDASIEEAREILGDSLII